MEAFFTSVSGIVVKKSHSIDNNIKTLSFLNKAERLPLDQKKVNVTLFKKGKKNMGKPLRHKHTKNKHTLN